jgi:hypothetical protein
VITLSVILREYPTGFLVYQRISMRLGGTVIAETFGTPCDLLFDFLFPITVLSEELFDYFPVLEFCRASSRGRCGSDEAKV